MAVTKKEASSQRKKLCDGASRGGDTDERAMRVVQLIAGAGGMYCGSCLKDNRLAATLIKQGRDVVLLPLYTPIRTDEPSVSRRDVHFGGINVFLQQRSAVYRHVPRFLRRLLDAPWLLRAAGGAAARTRAEDLGALTVSVLQGEGGPQRGELARLIADMGAIGPSLVSLPNLMFVGMAGAIRRALQTPVVCMLAGEDVFLDALPDPFRHQALDLIHQGADDVNAFVAPTRYYAAHAVKHFDLPRERVHHVAMGIEVGDIGPPPERRDDTFTIGYLARICREKGLAELAEAFALLRRGGRNVRLRIAGYLGAADRPYCDKVRGFLRDQGLDGSTEFLGELTRSEKITYLHSLDCLSVPTVYRESKGLYILEALACGVPVVQPRHGSFPELIEQTGGGVLYDPTGAAALSDALAQLMDDRALRARLGKRGRESVLTSFNADVMAERTWSLYEQTCDKSDV